MRQLNLNIPWTSIVEVFLAILTGFLGGALVLTAFGYNALESLLTMITYGFRDLSYLASKAAPLILSALAFLIPLRAGLFNIGGEGQAYAGALVALAFSKIGFYIAIPAGAITGGILGALAGLLRAYRGVNEVVTTIMLNWALFYVSLFVISEYLYDPIYTHQTFRVDRMLGLHELILLTLMAVIATYILLFYTGLGYRIRLMGSSTKTARYAGVRMEHTIVSSMAIGGFMGGLAGVAQVYGVTGVVDSTLSTLYGLGFLGIGVALISRANPLAVIPAALLVSGLIIGGQWMELRFDVAPELADVIIGLVILSLSTPYAYKLLMSKFRGAEFG